MLKHPRQRISSAPQEASPALFSRWVVTVFGAFLKVYIPYRSLIEALYTLNSPPFPNPRPLPRPHTHSVRIHNGSGLLSIWHRAKRGALC